MSAVDRRKVDPHTAQDNVGVSKNYSQIALRENPCSSRMYTYIHFCRCTYLKMYTFAHIPRVTQGILILRNPDIGHVVWYRPVSA